MEEESTALQILCRFETTSLPNCREKAAKQEAIEQ